MSSYTSEWPDYADTLPDGTEMFSGSIVRSDAITGHRILTDTKQVPYIPTTSPESTDTDVSDSDFLEIHVPNVTVRIGSTIIVHPVVTGGVTPYTFSYQGLSDIASELGSLQARVTVTDSEDESATTSVTITVVP